MGEYKNELKSPQIELVQVQRHLIQHGHRVLVIFEGRDAAGKDGTIKRITEHLSPRETRVVALGKPSDREQTQWYFQRYVPYLPAAGEFALFNRSWYNRAGVERVMGFCTKAQTGNFLESVVPFEQMLVGDGLQIIKYYLDISRGEQKRRLRERARDPLTQWKVSPIDQQAQKKWDAYAEARYQQESGAPQRDPRSGAAHRMSAARQASGDAGPGSRDAVCGVPAAFPASLTAPSLESAVSDLT